MVNDLLAECNIEDFLKFSTKSFKEILSGSSRVQKMSSDFQGLH